MNTVLKRYLFIFLITNLHSTFAQKSGLDASLTPVSDYYKAGQLFIEIDSPEAAFNSLKLGLALSDSLQNDSLIAKGNLYIANYFSKKGDQLEAISRLNVALSLYEKLNNQSETSNCHKKLGSYYRKISNFEKALFHNFEALRINEALDNEVQIALVLNQIGSIYMQTRDFEATREYVNRALALNRKNGATERIVANLLNLGVVNQKAQNFEEALKYFRLALVDAAKMGLKINQSILLGNIGSTLRSLNNYEESLEYLFKALDLKKELQRYGSAAHTCCDIAETYIEMKRYKEARSYASMAVDFSKNENLYTERYAYFLLSKCDYALNDFKSSYDYLRLYNNLNDSIFNIEKATSISKIQTLYETEKRDLQIQAQKSDIALLAEKNTVKNQWLVFGSIGLAGFFIVILLTYSRNNAKKRQAEQEQFSKELLEAQEVERTRISKDLHDSVGQQLTLIKKKAQNLEQVELSNLTNTALEEVRSISRNLFPTTLKQLGLSESIEQLLYDLDEESEMFFSVEIENINEALNEEKTLNFYRFIQESVTNVLKHSQAKTLVVSINKTGQAIEALIKDNGNGFDHVQAAMHKSLGLKTMVQRVSILEGTLSIKSKKGEGTTVLAHIPV